MSSKSNYYLWHARAAYVTLAGLIVAFIVFLGGSLTAALWIVLVTAVITIAVHLAVDRPRARSRSRGN